MLDNSKMTYDAFLERALEQIKLYKEKRDSRSKALMMKTVAKIIPYEKVALCRKELSFGNNEILIISPLESKPYYKGLFLCHSIHACPLCSSHILYNRSLEIKEAVDHHKGSIFLVTLTLAHKRDESTKSVLSSLKKAVRRLKASTAWNNLPMSGHITSTEVTYGASGPHPHIHMLLFMEAELDKSMIKSEISSIWKKCLSYEDRRCIEDIGFDIRDGSKASNYLSKWGLSEEISLSYMKSGKMSLTPWEILFIASISSCLLQKDKAYEVFREYYYAFKGTKKITWSPELKKQLLFDKSIEKEDASTEQDVFARLSNKSWKAMMQSGAQNKLIDLLAQKKYKEAYSLISLYT